MKKRINHKILFCLGLLSLFVSYSLEMNAQQRDVLYTNKPALNWHEAFPLGNGRMGAMVYGGVFDERIQTNEDTFWAGGPRILQKEGTFKFVKEARKMIASNRTTEAEELINAKILGPYYHSYLPFVDIIMNFVPNMGEVDDYKRELNLATGVLTVSYRLNGLKYQREYFISHPDQALIVRLICEENALTMDLGLQSKVKHRSFIKGNAVYIEGQAPDICWPHYEQNTEVLYSDTCGMRFQGRLMIAECDGNIQTNGNKLHIQEAREVVLAFVAATGFNGFDKNPVTEGKNVDAICENYQLNIEKKRYREIYNVHVKDFSALYNRVSLFLGEDEEAIRPIDERIACYTPGKDAALTALYFQFGRYLLISSSRAGTQPANLQGIWCDDMQAAWSSNYTLNCNVEINYWPTEVANLSECHLPLMQLIKEATVDGAKTAKILYNSPGWTAHHNMDLWRTTWPVGKSGQWGIYQAAPAWLCQHIWTHYEFTQDHEFLRKYLPVMEEAARFYLHTMQKTKEGYWVTTPSVSFENSYVQPNGIRGWGCQGPSSDIQAIRVLFDNIRKSEKILGIKSSLRQKIDNVYPRLAPIKISPRTGELQEWYDDWDNAEDANGQVSHGWGFIASDLMSLRRTPKLAKAFRKTLDKRQPMYKSNSGSWTGAFAVGWWARLEEPDSLQKTIDRHFKQALYPNLTSQFCGYFQIDGNLGFTSAIAEMLLQSHSGDIHILPALPSKYPQGYVRGLKARGNYEVDIYWKQCVPTKIVIRSKDGGDVSVRWGKAVKQYAIPQGGSLILNGELEQLF